MKKRTGLRYAKILFGVILTATLGASIPLFTSEPECITSTGQTVVKWKDMYWFPCKYVWNGVCIWPLRRKHITYKVTVTEGTPIRNDKGRVVPSAGGKRKDWQTYDSSTWNALAAIPIEKNRYPDYEPIADNEYVVMVEMRYRLFHKVEANLRICTQSK